MTLTTELDQRRTRAAHNQSFFREVNERIDELSTQLSAQPQFICECQNTGCVETISMTPEAYRQIRRDPNCFFVVPGHEVADVEETLAATDGYLLVRKLGAGAGVAIEDANV